MPWPYATIWDFETGTATEIGAITENGTPVQLDVAHYTELARKKQTPFSGAYCMRIRLNGAAETSYVTDAALDIADAETGRHAFAMFLSSDFALSGTNTITIFQVHDGGTTQAEIRLLISSSTLRFAVFNDTAGTDQVIATTYDVPLGEWLWVELLATNDNTNGLATLYVTRKGEPRVTVATTAGGNNATAAPDNARLGVVINGSTGNSGEILFDWFRLHDDADGNVGLTPRPEVDRWHLHRTVEVSQHVFVGPGKMTNLTLVTGGDTGDTMEARVYDTDRAETTPDRLVALLHSESTAGLEVKDLPNVPIDFQDGCYIQLLDNNAVLATSGSVVAPSELATTLARAIVSVEPRHWGSRSQIVQYGLKRPPI